MKVIPFRKMERRKFSRYQVNKPAFCSLGQGGFIATVRNMSIDGFFIVPGEGYVDGNLVNTGIEDYLSKGDKVELQCNGAVVPVVVRWVGDLGFGVEMEHMLQRPTEQVA